MDIKCGLVQIIKQVWNSFLGALNLIIYQPKDRVALPCTLTRVHHLIGVIKVYILLSDLLQAHDDVPA